MFILILLLAVGFLTFFVITYLMMWCKRKGGKEETYLDDGINITVRQLKSEKDVKAEHP